jgi:peptidoglycan/LPS O-acetylase OafA/YrhL
MKRFEVLDSWRGVCAMMVALYHFPFISFVADLGVIRSGWLFVDFFFVLSGFVITHAYRTEIAYPGDTLQFIRRRFFRLYPLHFCTLSAVLAWTLLLNTARMIGAARYPELFHAHETLFDGLFEKIVRHLILLQGFTMSDVGLNAPSWSISVEFWTYTKPLSG